MLDAERRRSLPRRDGSDGSDARARALSHHLLLWGYKGTRDASDIQPADFLGEDWWPRDEDFDRKLRGRLRFINQELQHLSWQRVLNKDPLLVSVTLLAHEVHRAMDLFVDELNTKRSDWFPPFDLQRQYVTKLLPRLDRPAETAPHLAPPRRKPTPP